MRVVNFGDLGSTTGWKTGRSFVVVIVVWDDCSKASCYSDGRRESDMYGFEGRERERDYN
jgi:hypothetical protein